MVELEDTKLHEAVRLGDVDLVEEALEDGLDPDAIGLYQWCPLHEAASNGDIEVLETLLQHLADPNQPDNLHSSTPLHYAAKEGHVDCLKALIKAGGRFDAENADGDTPLDLAEGPCCDILDRERTKQFVELSLTDAREVIHCSNSKESIGDIDFTDSKESIGDIDYTDKLNRTLGVRSTPTAWENIEVIEQGKPKSGTGLLQCSFEYNSKTGAFKIRVWQVEEVLMPPGEFSSISRIYVKSHLLPDKKGESKRRTDEVKVEDSYKMQSSFITLKRQSALEGFRAIFLPSTFKFTKPLVYKDIDKDTLSLKTVHLDVCVRIKYSTKSLPVASFQIPLKEAVRKLRKEKFRLLPCINYSAPDNVHTTDPNDFIVVMEGLYTNRTLSNPTLRKKTAGEISKHEEQERALSDVNLRTVRCHSVESIPTVSVSISSEEDKGLEMEDLTEVKVHRTTGNRQNPNSATTIVDIHHEGTQLPGSTEDDVMVIKVEAHKSEAENYTTVDLRGLVSETAFNGEFDETDKGQSKNAVIPKILVTTPEGFNDKGESMAIEMRHLLTQKMKKESTRNRRATERKTRKKTNFNAKPGHVVDLRTKEGEVSGTEPQKWAVHSPPVIKNKPTHEKKDDAEDGMKEKLEREIVKEPDGRGERRGKVTYNIISEEEPRERRSPRVSPRTSPSRSPSSDALPCKSKSPCSSLSSRGSPAPRRARKPLSESKMTSTESKHKPINPANEKMEYMNEIKNKVVTTPIKIHQNSKANDIVSSSHVDVVDETSLKECPSLSRKSKYSPVRALPTDIPPSPLVVKEVCEIAVGKSSTAVHVRLKRPSSRRRVDFGITPPITKGLKTTDLVSSNSVSISKVKYDQSKLNLLLLENEEEDKL